MTQLPQIETEVVEYHHETTPLQGYIARPAKSAGKIPGVLVVHEWFGEGGYSRMRAEKLAQLGYAGFAIDMYGKGVRAKDSDEAAKLAMLYRKDPPLLRARAAASYDFLSRQDYIDPARIAVIGYCFGGAVALEMARAGIITTGAVSFHGALDTSMPAEAGKLKAKILLFHGADDPFVPQDKIAAFQEEMRTAQADCQLVQYSGVVHSFTNMKVGNDKSKGMAYDEKADRRSWQGLRNFLAEIFA